MPVFWSLTGLAVLVVLVVLGVCLYCGYCLRRLGRPTRGKMIDPVSRPNSALVVIDVQEDFTRNTGKHAYAPQARDLALAAINREISAAREVGMEVIFVRNVFRDWPVILAMKLSAGGIGTPDREGLKFDRTLDVGSSPVFEKSIGDSFSCPDFEIFLAERKVGRLILTGLDACHCVQLIAKGALARGYDVEIREPATLTTAPENWAALKEGLRTAGAVLA